MQNYDGQFKLNGQEYFYRAKDDSGSSKITRVNNEEHHYRMVEITNKETGNYDVMMISTGDSFTRVVNRGCPKDPTQLALNSQGMLSNTKDRNESKTFLYHRRRLPPLQVASKK